MKTKDYVRLFKLDKPFYEFSREKFLNKLGEEFSQRIEETRLDRQKRNLEFTFSIFNKIVKEIEIKFWYSQMVLRMDCNHDCINSFKRCMDVY